MKLIYQGVAASPDDEVSGKDCALKAPNISAMKKLLAQVACPLRRTRLWRIRARDNTQPAKVFCIGRNKTGTTSLQTFFSEAGFRVAPQWRGETLIHHSRFSPSDEFWRWVERYEVFQDAPFSWTWFLPLLINRYPDALYVLSVRDEEDWFESLINHHYEHLQLPRTASNEEIKAKMQADTYIAPGYMYDSYIKQYGEPGIEPMYDKTRLIDGFRQHNLLAQSLVPDSQLLLLDVASSSSASSLCEFLGLPPSFGGSMPKTNVRRPK